MDCTSNGATSVLLSNLVLNSDSFYMLQEPQLRELWVNKYIDATAYILMIVRIHGKANWKWSFKVENFCKEWGIVRRTFYWAVSRLKADGMLQWESSEKFTMWYGDNLQPVAQTNSSKPVNNGVNPVCIPTSMEVNPNGKQTIAQSEQTIAQSEQTIAQRVQSIALEKPEPLADTESRQSSDSSQIFLNQTDNRTVAGEKTLKEEEEVDKAIESVAEPPKEEVDSTAGAVAEPLVIEPPSTPLSASALEEVAEPPIIESHPTPLPTLEESPQVEPTIPNVEIIPPLKLNNDKVIKSNSQPAKQLNNYIELEEEEVEKKVEPTSEEVREVLQHLRGIGVTLNYTIQAIVKKHYASVSGAIAHLKERINSGERFRNIEGAFVKAVKEGAKPEGKRSLGGIPQETNPPSSEQLALLEAARIAGKIRDYFLSSDGVCKVVLNDMLTQKAWWEYLGVAATD